MNKNDIHLDDLRISALLRESRVSPALPPCFQQNVWRHIENAEAPARPASWLDALAAWVLRPRLAFATATMLLFAGILMGVREGSQSARNEAQARYLAVVAPATLR